MTVFKNKAKSKANASIISMLQRFSDIFIIFVGVYFICKLNQITIGYIHLLLALLVLVIFQMIGGLLTFIALARCEILTELNLIIQNWTLSILIASGVFSIFIDYDLSFKFILQWYVFVDVGFVLSRSSIRFLAGIVRKLGYNTRRVAVAGSMPVGFNLLKGFWMSRG